MSATRPMCLFCRIVAGTVPSRQIYGDDRLVAFHDINPQAPLHVLVVPRRHVSTLNDLEPGDDALIGEMVRRAAAIADSERKTKERDLSNLNRDLQRQGREFREDLNLRRNEELGQIQERARKATQEIARAEKFDLIVEQAVFVDPKSDITERVMKALGGK